MRLRPHLFAGLLATGFTLSCRAENATAVPGPGSGTFLQAMLALTLIVGLLVATAWLARKVTGGKGFGQGGMHVVGGVALGPRERIVLLEVGEQWLVVGIVPGQIRTLHSMPKGELANASIPMQGNPVFAQWLKHLGDRQRDA